VDRRQACNTALASNAPSITDVAGRFGRFNSSFCQYPIWFTLADAVILRCNQTCLNRRDSKISKMTGRYSANQNKVPA